VFVQSTESTTPSSNFTPVTQLKETPTKPEWYTSINRDSITPLKSKLDSTYAIDSNRAMLEPDTEAPRTPKTFKKF